MSLLEGYDKECTLEITDLKEKEGPTSSAGYTAEDLIPDKLYSKALYKDVYEGVDIVYSLHGFDLKEEIILKERQEKYSFSFLLDLKGLSVEENEDGSISLSDEEGILSGGTGAAVIAGIGKIIGTVLLNTGIGAGIGYLTGGKEGAIDGAINGYMFGSFSACGSAAVSYITSPANGIDTYSNLRLLNKGTENQVHHIIEKRFANSLGITNTNDVLSVTLSRAEHQVFTNAWRSVLPYGQQFSKLQIIQGAVKVYSKSPKLLLSALKTCL